VSVGQPQKISAIINSLKEYKLSDFEKIANNLTSNDTTIQFNMLFSNSITNQYKAYVYQFDEARVVNKKLVEPFYTYRINLVCDGDKIIGSILTNISLSKEKNVYSYNDTYSIKAFDKAYKDTFGDTSHFDMLFKKDVVFGTSCGGFGGGTSPEFYSTWHKAVATKNINKLEKWLFCHLPSYRVWAVFGLYELKEKGYKITTKQRNRIMTLWKSNAIVEVCSGCEGFDRTESQVINQYVFE